MTYRIWPKHKPIPPGWSLISVFERQIHGRYSVLIGRKTRGRVK